MRSSYREEYLAEQFVGRRLTRIWTAISAEASVLIARFRDYVESKFAVVEIIDAIRSHIGSL